MNESKRSIPSTVYRAIAAAICFTGVAQICGVFAGAVDFTFLCYFTIQSNLLCLLLWAALLARPAISERLRGGVTIAILLTMTVYHFLLGGGFGDPATWAWDNVIVHYITPLLMLFDFAAWGRRGRLRAVDPLLWAIYPLCYFGFAMALGASGVPIRGTSSYVYPFLDAGVLSAGEIARNVVLISLGYIACGYLIFGADRLLARAGRKAGVARDA